MENKKKGECFFVSFIVISILTGFVPHFIGTPDPNDYDLGDSAYYLGEQLSELLLLITLFLGYRPTKKEIYAVISLCVAELWDEVFGRNLDFDVYDFVLIALVFILIGTLFRKDNERVE